MSVFGPDVDLRDPAFIHPSAQIYGRVIVEEGASFWLNAVARAENDEVVVGAYSNIQDFVMLHVGLGGPTRIGAYCSITHHATVHGCVIGDNCLIGINATIMDDCVIGDNCIIGGNSLLPEGTEIPDNSVVMGVPGKIRAERNNFVANRLNAVLYHENAKAYAVGNYRRWSEPSLLALIAAERDRLADLLRQAEAAAD